MMSSKNSEVDLTPLQTFSSTEAMVNLFCINSVNMFPKIFGVQLLRFGTCRLTSSSAILAGIFPVLLGMPKLSHSSAINWHTPFDIRSYSFERDFPWSFDVDYNL